MIKQLINIDGYWKVIVYYNVDYNFFSDIAFELKAIGSPVEKIDDVYYNLKYKAKAVTCSNIKNILVQFFLIVIKIDMIILILLFMKLNTLNNIC